MPIFAVLLVAAPVLTPKCRPEQLHASVDARGGDFNGMSHSGTELSIRNTGPDCMMIALPTIQFRDRRNRLLPVVRQPPRGMHPGPVMLPIQLANGHSASTDLRWVSGPVFPHTQSVSAAHITVMFGSGMLTIPWSGILYGETAKPVKFEQTPLRAVESKSAN